MKGLLDWIVLSGRKNETSSWKVVEYPVAARSPSFSHYFHHPRSKRSWTNFLNVIAVCFRRIHHHVSSYCLILIQSDYHKSISVSTSSTGTQKMSLQFHKLPMLRGTTRSTGSSECLDIDCTLRNINTNLLLRDCYQAHIRPSSCFHICFRIIQFTLGWDQLLTGGYN